MDFCAPGRVGAFVEAGGHGEARDGKLQRRKGNAGAPCLAEADGEVRSSRHQVGGERTAERQLGAVGAKRGGGDIDRAGVLAGRLDGQPAFACEKGAVRGRRDVAKLADEFGAQRIGLRRPGHGDRSVEDGGSVGLHAEIAAPIVERAFADEREGERRTTCQVQALGENAAGRLGQVEIGGEEVAFRVEPELRGEIAGAIEPFDREIAGDRLVAQGESALQREIGAGAERVLLHDDVGERHRGR